MSAAVRGVMPMPWLGAASKCTGSTSPSASSTSPRASAPPGATFERADARALDYDGGFEAAISLCQGAFGLVGPGADTAVLAGLHRALEPGGRAAVSAFSSYFSVRYQTDADFDVATGVAHERTEVRNEGGEAKAVELWTTCYTPRELGLLFTGAGFAVDALWSVEPGAYARDEPTIELPELLVVASPHES